MKMFEQLAEIRKNVGQATTTGLADHILQDFAASHPTLPQVVDEAYERFKDVQKTWGALLKKSESELCLELQKDFVNFYPDDQVNPYIPLAAGGPWVVTCYGAVLHDSGGYGMLGLGHGPQEVINAMKGNYVMANIMTPSFSQKRLTDRLSREIGQSRSGEKPFAKFLCMNSGSEAVTVAARISDINAKKQTDPGARYEGYKIKTLAFAGGFHGRTDRPAQFSDSTKEKYKNLASFRDFDRLVTIAPNDGPALEAAFKQAEKDKVYFEAFFMEPVMGEGNPGRSVTPEFYNLARKLTKQYGTLLVVDSIQAGLRAQGVLSITDYPGFEKVEAPDMEIYSKALNAGQYPLSVLAMRDETAKIYIRGVYGNTMTANPRALEVACTVLDALTPEIRKNIRERGKELLDKFGQLQKEFPDAVVGCQGTGLLCSLALKPEGYRVVGAGAIEQTLRQKGIGVIHGGKNALRFTPHFKITTKEIDLIISEIRVVLKKGPIFK